MKTRLNITIEESLLDSVKTFAAKQKTSVSGLIEEYLKKIVRHAKENNLIDMVEALKPDNSIITESLQKENFYEQQKAKYGF